MSRKPGDKCKLKLLCPQCVEETGKSQTFGSFAHFSQHLIKHAEVCTSPEGTEYKTSENWFPKWAQKFMELNGYTRFQRDGVTYLLSKHGFFSAPTSSEGCVTCSKNMDECAWHDTQVPFKLPCRFYKNIFQ
jgi:hypothetical protein